MEHTLIGGLLEQKHISVEELAQNPAINLREQGCWVSCEIDSTFRQIACVELLDYNTLYKEDISSSTILTSTFSTLKIMLEELTKQNKNCSIS